MPLRLASAALALTLAAACTGSADPRPGAEASPDADPPDRSRGLRGVVYVHAGEVFHQDLYRVDFGPLRVEPVVEGRRISLMGGCGDELAVSAPAPLGDAAHLLRDGRLKLIPGLGRRHASNPALSQDCRLLAYERPADPRAEDPIVVRVFDLAERTGRSVLEGSGMSVENVSFRPDGQISILRRERGRSEIVLMGDDGPAESLDVGSERVRDHKWSRRGWLAAVVPERHGLRTIVYHPESGRRNVVVGWWVLDWSPYDNKLLLGRGRTRLAILARPMARQVRPIGKLPLRVYGGAWLRRDP